MEERNAVANIEENQWASLVSRYSKGNSQNPTTFTSPVLDLENACVQIRHFVSFESVIESSRRGKMVCPPMLLRMPTLYRMALA